MQNSKPALLNSFLLIAIAIGVLLRIVQLGSREFWYDEVLSLLLSTGNKIFYQTAGENPVRLADYHPLLSLPAENNLGDSLKTLVNLLKGILAEPHPPLFFLEQHFWLRLLGNSEAAMRSLVMLFSLGAMGCAYGLGRCLLGYRGGLLLAALLGLNPYYLFHSLNVRMYGSLVFWVLLTGWAWAELVYGCNLEKAENPPKSRIPWLWWLVVTLGTAGGLLTFYYFALWIVTLVIGVLLWNRRQWWQFALAFGLGGVINLPWWLWGTRQQLRNADLDRFAESGGFLESLLKHLQELVQTLGIHLIIGDWATASPAGLLTLAGLGAIAILAFASYGLLRSNQSQLLAIGLLLGIFPLLLMLVIDIAKGQYTLGFGFGRSVIFVLPGCLLILAAAGVKTGILGQNILAVGLILLYLMINLADVNLRSRTIFQQLATEIDKNPHQSTLIAMNSPAWGHVLRLAYYLPPASPIELLAQKSTQLPQALKNALKTRDYDQILWLDVARPIWGKVSSEDQRQQIQQILTPHYKLDRQQFLQGTWELDNYFVRVYEKTTH